MYFINKTIIALLICLSAFLVKAQQAKVITFAGSGTAISKDGMGANAEFYAPNGIAIDKYGNIFVTDQGSYSIRKITPCGVVTTVAGGTYGFKDGLGSSAKFELPVRIAVDGNDNLYVADRDNQRIRKITPDGMVTTLAGNGNIGTANGAGNIAEFNYPTGVAVDTSGNVYVADQLNHCIRKITPGGIVSLYSGIPGTWGFSDGPALTAQFHNPASTAVDLQGNVYVSDVLNVRIRKITPTGIVTTLAGNGNSGYMDGLGAMAKFSDSNNTAMRVSVDTAGNVYVADQGNNAIRKITANGFVSTIAGNTMQNYKDTAALSAEFNHPTGAVADLHGNIFIADFGNNVIRELTTDTTKPHSNIDSTICEGQSVFGYTTSGTYIDTLTAANGCDSIRTLHLTVNKKSYSTIDTTICEGKSVFGYTFGGTHIDTLTATNGCDSIRTLNLTVNSKSYSSIDTAICEGQSIFGYTTNGIHVDTLTAANGCDSIRTLNLKVNTKSYSNIDTSICKGQSVFGYNESGTYTDTLPATNGCDSIRTLNLKIIEPSFSDISISICDGQSYDGYTQSGTYIDTLSSRFGCDSIRTLHLTVKFTSSSIITKTICSGQNYEGYTNSGTYTDTLLAYNGCDSIRTIQLTILPLLQTVIDTAICYPGNFKGYTITGTYFETLQSAISGCDSTVVIHLTILQLPKPALGLNSVICPTQPITITPGNFTSYLWQDGSTQSTYTVAEPNTYSVTVTNSCGSASASVTYLLGPCDIYFPNAFTPNNDERNDNFKVLNGNSLSVYHLIIYNRWGQKVFETTDVNKVWDGTVNGDQQEGTSVYVWYCEYLKRGDSQKKSMKGTVTLLH